MIVGVLGVLCESLQNPDYERLLMEIAWGG